MSDEPKEYYEGILTIPDEVQPGEIVWVEFNPGGSWVLKELTDGKTHRRSQEEAEEIGIWPAR